MTRPWTWDHIDRLEEAFYALKREHAQLRAAADAAYLAWCFNQNNRDPLSEVRTMGALRAALDATTADPVRDTFDPNAVRAIQAALQFSDRLPEYVVRQLGDVIRASERK